MNKYHIEYNKTGYFSKSMVDLLSSSSNIEEFIGHFSNPDSFKKKMEERNSFDVDRNLLVERLQDQNKTIKLNSLSEINIESLLDSNSFTICTGHQLSLFSGHLYFIYKIASIIKLTQELKKLFPDKNFVPLFWLASEDHDFDEIKSFKYKSNKFDWKKDASGAVGRLGLDGLDSISKDFSEILGKGKRANYLIDLFEKSYLEHDNLSSATRYLVNELFGDYGVVVLDGDDKMLKSEMKEVFKRELLENTSDKNISKTNERLKSKSYKIQVGHREINLFYLKENTRERIVFDQGKYRVINTDIVFSEAEILKELDQYPENFSPNAIMRPLYEEKILPNLAYIGGGGELAYWMQLKDNFEDLNISYPILVLRNSLMYLSKNQFNKIQSLDLSFEDVFLKEEELIKSKIDQLIDVNLSKEREKLEELFNSIRQKDLKDKSLVNSIDAHLHKQQDLLTDLEKKLKRAERKIYSDKINKLRRLKQELFPLNGLQERVDNYSELYMEFGNNIIADIIENISVLDNKFTILIND